MSAPDQKPIRRATYRVLHESPGHVTFGFWVNGGKCGELTVQVEEVAGFHALMDRWQLTTLEKIDD